MLRTQEYRHWEPFNFRAKRMKCLCGMPMCVCLNTFPHTDRNNLRDYVQRFGWRDSTARWREWMHAALFRAAVLALSCLLVCLRRLNFLIS